MNKMLPFRVFILSHLLLLISSLALLGGMYYILNEGNLICCTSKNTLGSYLPITTKPVSFDLRVNSPEDDFLTIDKSIIISGETTSRASIFISAPNFDTAFETTPKGDFSKVVTLEEGINILTINAFNSSGDTKTIVKNIYYSKDKLDD